MREKGQVICIVEFQLINVEGEREIDHPCQTNTTVIIVVDKVQ